MDRSSTQWTVRVTIKPHVDAVNMEGVITPGQNAGFLIVLEIRQANGAFEWREMAGFGGVNKSGDCFNDRRIQTFGSNGGWKCGSGNGEQVLSTTAAAEENTSVVVEAEYNK